MALIDCPECGKQISDRAPACIHCGNPIAAPAPPPPAPGPIITTQATSKPWKVIQAIGAAMMIIGMVSCIANAGSGSAAGSFSLFILGGIITLVGRIGAWWTNG